MSVLILTGEHDPSADLMVSALEKREAIVHRVDTSWFPGQLSVTAELASGRWCGTLRTPHRTIDLDTITAVWYREPKAFDFPEMTPTERMHANIEAKYGLGGILTTLPVLWVNHPARVADAAYKPVQLVAAHRAGLTVPDTLLTNEADAAREFGRRGRTVTKMLGGVSLVEEGTRRYARTRLLDPSDFEDMRGLERTMHQFQRWASKAKEVRVVAIGDQLNAIEIHAHSAKAYVDYRSDYRSLRYQLTDLPESVEVGVRQLMKHLGLLYGAIDFVVGPTNEWTFLEINPSGQYGWLENHTDAPLTDQLADLLAGGTA
ncbi:MULTISPECIES: ATP-grasp ribosomal peptide maturase [Amycolatopsis]|uniref:RimK domain-containing protein n=2 Tax=Amycolatopsis TaxID=1813 RepID=A0A229S5B2_9PSEU|nr:MULTISPECIES: ATP-grasp ribosomal peptide maturase [Amycolatopsis]AXB41321.1 RimK domain-containing protein [Amycolatopsis albispora]OXM53794.1 RimK domain-containing protein [Amycolatopsis thailandensis]